MLPQAGPRLSRRGELGALPAAQTESEVRGQKRSCQPCAWLPERLSGCLMCQALLAAAPHPALSRRPSLLHQSSVCLSCLVGTWLQGSGSWAGPTWARGDRWEEDIHGHFPCQALCQRLCVQGPKPSGPCLLGCLVSGVLMVLFPGLGNLGDGEGGKELSLGLVSVWWGPWFSQKVGRPGARGGVWLNTGVIT